MTRKPFLGTREIQGILPHRPPFLFVDRVTAAEPGVRILAERDLRAEEPYFHGHFPGAPVMPGVLVAEALAQACGLLLALSVEDLGSLETPLFLAQTELKFPATAGPGDTLRLEARLDKVYGTLFRFQVEARTAEALVAKGSLVLGSRKA